MKKSFIKKPTKGFFQYLLGVIFPKQIHLVYGTGGKITDEEKGVRAYLNQLGVEFTWYMNDISGIWGRPNQVFMFDKALQTNWRYKKVRELAKKYKIRIIYFDGATELMNKATEYATSE